LRRDVLFSLAAAAAHNGGRLVAVLLLAKLASAEILGAYTYALSLITPLVLLAGLEVRPAFVSDVRGLFSFGCYARARRAGLTLAAVGVAALAAAEGMRRGDLTAALLIAGVGAGRIAWSTSELAWGVFQRSERFDRVAMASLLRGGAQVAAFAIPVLVAAFSSTGDTHRQNMRYAVVCAVWGCAAAWTLLHVLLEQRATDQEPGLEHRAAWADVRRLALQTLPLGLVQLLIALGDTVPRVWIASSGHAGLEQLGYFGALAYVALAIQLGLVAVATGASHRLALYYHAAPHEFRRLARRLVRLSLIAGVAVLLLSWLGGRWLLAVLYRPEYAAHFPAFMLLMLAQCLSFPAGVFGFAVTSMRRFWVQGVIHTVVLGVTVVASVVLIRGPDPVLGAAWVAVLRSAAHALLYAACVAHAVRRMRSAAGAD
jgi:O-antigen/teichoic acid export membrane protein